MLIYMVLMFGVVGGAVYFLIWAQKKSHQNLLIYLVKLKGSYDSALDELAKNSADPQRRAQAIEKGHLYYKGLGGEAIMRNQKGRLKPEELPRLQYQTDHHARENLVQADIASKLNKGK